MNLPWLKFSSRLGRVAVWLTEWAGRFQKAAGYCNRRHMKRQGERYAQTAFEIEK